jgi:hypothetical protein
VMAHVHAYGDQCPRRAASSTSARPRAS